MDARQKALSALGEAEADLAKLLEIHGRLHEASIELGRLFVEQGALLQATKGMQETQMSFNLQYLELQSQMQNENRSYTAVSNIMKTKHDTVKNSISNIR
jgi:hypothetical protein